MSRHFFKYLPKNHIITGGEYYESDFAYKPLCTIRSIIPFKMKGATIEDVRKKYRMWNLNMLISNKNIYLKILDINKFFVTWPDNIEYAMNHFNKNVLNILLFNDIKCVCGGRLEWNGNYNEMTCVSCGRRYKNTDMRICVKKFQNNLLNVYFGGGNDTPAGA